LPKTTNIFTSSLYIAGFDSIVAIFGGLIIFPALFALGENPASGPSLVFIVLPKLFAQMTGGSIVGALFFVLLSIAALTSTISLLEVPVSYMVDEKKAERRKIVWKVTLLVFIIGLPSALSQGDVDFFTNFGLLPAFLTSADFLSQMSFLFGDLILTIGGLLLCIFIGWVWGAEKAAEELMIGSENFKKFKNIWIFLVKYLIPIVVFIILIGIFIIDY
jgi:NSS family neurotransmitter:Na+ symporter